MSTLYPTTHAVACDAGRQMLESAPNWGSCPINRYEPIAHTPPQSRHFTQRRRSPATTTPHNITMASCTASLVAPFPPLRVQQRRSAVARRSTGPVRTVAAAAAVEQKTAGQGGLPAVSGQGMRIRILVSKIGIQLWPHTNDSRIRQGGIQLWSVRFAPIQMTQG